MYGLVSPWAWYTNYLQYFTFYYFSLVGFFWFCVGAYLRLHGGFHFNGAVSFVIGMGCISLRIILANKGFGFAHYFGWLSIPFTMHFLWSIVPSANWSNFSFAAFGIYLIHKFVLYPYQMVFSPFKGLGYCLAGWLLTVVVSVFAVRLLGRFFPSAANVLFGGRCVKR